LQMWVAGFGVVEYFADEVNWSLGCICSSDLRSFNDDGRANHSVGCRDVEQQSFAFVGRREDRRGREKPLKLCKSVVGLLRSHKFLGRFEKFEERQALIAEARYETA
jgi:hypothetical protein